MLNETIAWLVKSDEPWTRYRTMVDLLGLSEQGADVQSQYAQMLAHPEVRSLIEKAAAWPGEPIKRHNDAKLPMYALTTLAEFGVRADDPGIEAAAARILSAQSAEGAFQSTVQVAKAFGGSGEDMTTWILCDAAPLLVATASLAGKDDSAVQRAVTHLMSATTDRGWSCCAAASLGKFKGPGKRGDPCPIVAVWGLRALDAAGMHDCEVAYAAIEMLLQHYEDRGKVKYYLFGIGTDFHKLKYPFIWYDILHVVDTLTRFPAALRDDRLRTMVDAVTAQADNDGRYTASSMYLAWKGWSFADKKQPSPWLTFLVYRILQRMAFTQ